MVLGEGIDVSLYDPSIDGLLAGRGLCIVKVSEGNFVDALLAPHMASVRTARTEFVGAYHYLRIQWDVAVQVAVFLAAVPADADFLALDVEGASLEDPASRPVFVSMARAFIAFVHQRDRRPILLYSSRGTWPGDVGQDGNWVADYTGDPNRLWLRLLRRAVSWVVWQYSGTGVDLDRYDRDVLARLLGRATVGVPAHTGGELVKYIQISAADFAALPTIQVPAGTRVVGFDGTELIHDVGPTWLHRLPGLADGHTNEIPVAVLTGEYYADGVRRYTGQVAILP